MSRASHAPRVQYGDAGLQHSLPPGRHRGSAVLDTVCRFRGGCTLVDRARRLPGVEKSTLARNLDRLISSGLVMALPGEGRRVRHRLTAAGDEMFDRRL